MTSQRLNPILKIAVLVSGNGSNLQILIDAAKANELPVSIVGVISNNETAYAIERSKLANIDTAVLSHLSADQAKKPESVGKRMGIKTFERFAIQQLNDWQPDLIVLAGFMRVLSADFITQSPAPIINLHPSLLPKYKGLNTHQRALEASDAKHGCSIHIVTPELDGGAVLTQAILDVNNNDCKEPLNANSLQLRVQKLEHKILPWTILLIAKDVIPIRTLKQMTITGTLSDVDGDGDGNHINPNHTESKVSASYLPSLPLKLWLDV